MKTEEMVALAEQKALSHGLTKELVCAVIEQESAWHPWAYRYEPGFYGWLIGRIPVAQMAVFGACSRETEARMRATSWGLMQVMGQVARERGFKEPYMSQLCVPEIGIEYGCMHLAAFMKAKNGNEAEALLRWNGGGNPAYPHEVLARKRNYL